MPLTLEALAILDAIDRKGSFARAAEELGRAPSSLTYAVQQIEAELDALLFDRSGHRARFTPAGRVLLDEGRGLLGAAQALADKTRQVAGGWEPQLTLAVEGILPVAPLLPVLDAFYRLGRATEIRLRHDVLAGSWDALASGCADLAIAGGEAPASVPACSAASSSCSAWRRSTRWRASTNRLARPTSRRIAWW